LSKSQTNDVSALATVWLLDGRTVSDHQLLPYLAWLNPDEQQRYQRFLRPERQRQFLLGRFLLRCALGNLLNTDPSSISLSEQAGRAPLLNLQDASPGFSLSHSGPWIACAVSKDSVLGLDIEMLDETRDLLALAEQAFDAGEFSQVTDNNGAARVARFYTLWSQKEASYKLVSTLGRDAVPHCISLPHADISIVLCSESPLADVDLRIFDGC
jgi:4'-phosphopantetheinyl transferase